MTEVPYSRDAQGVRHEWTQKNFDDHLDSLSKQADALAEDTYQQWREARKGEIINKIVDFLEEVAPISETLNKSAATDAFRDGFADGIREAVLDLIEEARAI